MVSLLKNGKPYKMSKRAGNSILMSDVVNDIGSDALKFIFLSKKSDTHLEFDVEDMKKQDSSNPIFYINYAHARVNSIFIKAKKSVKDIIDIELKNINNDATDLLFNALLLPQILKNSFENRQIQQITEYLKNLASILHKFYNENKIIGVENENELLKVFATVALSIRVGLRLLGIKAKDSM